MYNNAHEVTADELNSWLPIPIQKMLATGRASNITPSADPDLVLNLKANYTYTGAFHVFLSSGNATGDWRGVLHWSSGTLSGSAISLDVSLASGSTGTAVAGATTRLDNDGTGIEVQAGSSANGTMVYMPFYITMGVADGTVSLWWAQVTSNATATNVLEGSWAVAQRVA